MSTLSRLLTSGGTMALFFQVLPIACLVGIAYAVYRCRRIQKQDLPVSWGREILRWLFVCYLTGLVNLVLTPNNLWSNVWHLLLTGHPGGQIGPMFTFSFNFIPTPLKYLLGQVTMGRWVKEMLLGNILMFLPMGFFLPLVSEKARGRKILKFAVLIPLSMEVLQPLAGRSFDVDDLLCNFLGILLGSALAALAQLLIKSCKKS